jgi:acetoacetate decarboxylase
MKLADVRKKAFSMPLHSPAYPPGPYRFVNREYLIISYRTDRAALEKLVPAPLEIVDPIVKYEFIRMPDSTGFGDYTESGQVIPVRFEGKMGGYVHSMFLDDDPPIAGGREIWGFPKKLANPKICVELDTLLGTLNYGPVRIATGSMGYKYKPLDHAAVAHSMEEQCFLLKIIPNADGSTRVCELVRYYLGDIQIKGAWTGPAALELHPHAVAPINDLPVLEVLSAVHLVADLTLNYGEVVHNYLAK